MGFQWTRVRAMYMFIECSLIMVDVDPKPIKKLKVRS